MPRDHTWPSRCYCTQSTRWCDWDVLLYLHIIQIYIKTGGCWQRRIKRRLIFKQSIYKPECVDEYQWYYWHLACIHAGGRAWLMEFHRFTMRMERDAVGRIRVHLSLCPPFHSIICQVHSTVLMIWLTAASCTARCVTPCRRRRWGDQFRVTIKW